MKDRVYICHTFYHAYIAVVKELNIRSETVDSYGDVTLILSTMSNDFGDLNKRVEKSNLFTEVYMFEEKEDVTSDKVMKYHKDRENMILNLLQRIKYTKKLGELQQEYIPVNLKDYKDIYVFCDSDPIGYYLCANKIRYHAIEDGLDCIAYYDTARYSNRGHFGLKAWMAKKGLIFIENGYSKYCIDMEVNDKSLIQYPTPNMIEKPRKDMFNRLTEEDKRIILSIFIEDVDGLLKQIDGVDKTKKSVMVLSEPLCDMATRERIFRDIIEEYADGCNVCIKPHPRDDLDYASLFHDAIIIRGRFPMEVMNDIPELHVDKIVSVFTQVNNIDFADECILLGEDFMDKYEDPAIHRQNEAI